MYINDNKLWNKLAVNSKKIQNKNKQVYQSIGITISRPSQRGVKPEELQEVAMVVNRFRMCSLWQSFITTLFNCNYYTHRHSQCFIIVGVQHEGSSYCLGLCFSNLPKWSNLFHLRFNNSCLFLWISTFSQKGIWWFPIRAFRFKEVLF